MAITNQSDVQMKSSCCTSLQSATFLPPKSSSNPECVETDHCHSLCDDQNETLNQLAEVHLQIQMAAPGFGK